MKKPKVRKLKPKKKKEFDEDWAYGDEEDQEESEPSEQTPSEDSSELDEDVVQALSKPYDMR